MNTLLMKADSQSKSYLLAFGGVVLARRTQIGISQEQLAQRSGLYRSYVGDIERGQRDIALLNIVRLAFALETSPEQLLQDVSASIAKSSEQNSV